MQPLVTIITPYTDDRVKHMANLQQYILRQTYDNYEHLIIDGKGSIATKRNAGCEAAEGEIIIHMDSDDWFAPDWIARTVEHMLITGCDCTGLDTAHFYEPHRRHWKYVYNGRKTYAIGGTLAYTKEIWTRNKFKETPDGFGEDTLFVSNAGRVVPHTYTDGFVAMIHGNNSTSHNSIRFNPRFILQNDGPVAMREIMGLDYRNYPIFV